MKILYAIQGTGNGHISRAKEIIPLLQQYGSLDIILSGTQVDVPLQEALFRRLHGFSFIFGKKGGVDHYATWKQMNLRQFYADMKSLPLHQYNLIINDFEPVTAWACKLKGVESVSLSHQAAFRSKLTPKPKSIDWAELILNHYAPSTHHVAFHFKAYDNFIHTPVIRREIRNLEISNAGHYTVYLPAIGDEYLLPMLKQIPEIEWQVFSKHSKHRYRDANVFVEPVDNESFNKSLASCAGFFTGGGFEGPAEALFLGKKLLVAPMRYQYEQQCNAYALKQMGLPILWASDHNWLPQIKDFVARPQPHDFHFPDHTAQIVEELVKKYAR